MRPGPDGRPCSLCGAEAVSMAYSEDVHDLVPVCRDHICAYRVHGSLWQAEDEWMDLLFARRSRWKWLAQAKILHDQRVARRGKTSLVQWWKTQKAWREWKATR